MKAREIKQGIHWVGALDWERRLFDELIPLPDGTTYNAYIVRGQEKTALIDTVDPPKTAELFARLDNLGVKSVDYIITHHAEQDHAGSLPAVLTRFSEAKVVCTPKCATMIGDLLGVPSERIITVGHKQTLPLGGRTLEFLHAPWVHWPETMLTYLKEDRLLFSCDLFGAHLAASDLYVTETARAYEAAKRYYGEIMMPFRSHIEKHLAMLVDYKIDFIAPSHGPLHKEPKFILDAYRDWVLGPPKNLVALPYVSMHGSTKAMVDYFADILAEKGVTVEKMSLSVTDIGRVAMSLVDAATLVLATPTVHAGPHPLAVYATYLANALRPKLKYAAIIGSYGWGGRTKEIILEMVPNLKAEVLGAVIAKGYPAEADYQALDGLAADIAKKHRAL
ncbi:FprA family A-type flavoprotein [Chloroflexota bacterium]